MAWARDMMQNIEQMTKPRGITKVEHMYNNNLIRVTLTIQICVCAIRHQMCVGYSLVRLCGRMPGRTYNPSTNPEDDQR